MNAEQLTILPNRLPALFDSAGEQFFPADLQGSMIVAIGAPKDRGGLEGGGLVIDYQPIPNGPVKRIVLAFNELGMWTEE